MDEVRQGMERLEIMDCGENIQDRDYWWSMTIATEVLTDL